MAFNNSMGSNGARTPIPPSPNRANAAPPEGWENLVPQQRVSPARRRQRRVITFSIIVMLIILIFAALRFSMVGTSDNDTLQIRVGDQQAGLLDLRQSSPNSPEQVPLPESLA